MIGNFWRRIQKGETDEISPVLALYNSFSDKLLFG
jgi:hypothetical protein